MNASRPSVCIIEDDAAARKSLETLLDVYGFQTHSVASAEEFLLADFRREVDGMVLDVRLPGMSGIELLDKLIEEELAVPTVVVSGHRNDEAVAQLAKFSSVWFLKKPFEPGRLIDWLRENCAS